MNLNERLKQYNAWRRSDVFDHLSPHDPTQIGKDIDEAIAKLAAAERLAEAVDNMTLQYGCICGHSACKRCKDTREAKDALTAYTLTKETP